MNELVQKPIPLTQFSEKVKSHSKESMRKTQLMIRFNNGKIPN